MPPPAARPLKSGSALPSSAAPATYQPPLTGTRDAFILKLDPSGQTAYSTYLAAPDARYDAGLAIAVDSVRSAYVAGLTLSAHFPLVHPLQSRPATGFVAKIDPTGSHLLYSTYLGGTQQDVATDLIRRAGGSLVLSGITGSRSFPAAKSVGGSTPGTACSTKTVGTWDCSYAFVATVAPLP